MALGTKTKQDDNVDEARNPFAKDADNRFNEYTPGRELSKRESAELGDIEKGLEQDGGVEGLGNRGSEGLDLNKEEDSAGSVDTDLYESGEGAADRPFKEPLNTRKMKDAVMKIAKSKNPLLAIFSMFGVTGVVIFLIFSPVSLLTSLSEQFQLFNDPTVPAFQQRALKLIGHISSNQENHNLCNRTKLSCHMGKFSNGALRKFQKNGIEPHWGNETRDFPRTVRPTYPDSNPTRYVVNMQDGTFRDVPAAELENFLRDRDNRKIARKVIGTGGVLSLRTKAWTSYYLREKFLNKFGLRKDGGLARMKSTVKRTGAQLRTQVLQRIPGAERISNAAGNLRRVVAQRVGIARKGGAGYMIAVASCVIPKLPKYVAVGLAAVQVAQIIGVVQEYALSPGSMRKAHGLDGGSGITTEDESSIAEAFTDPKPDEESGEMLSAMQSPYLLAALGVAPSPAPSMAFSPAYSLISSQFYRGFSAIEEGTREACNVILSPAAMYSAMAVNAAVIVAASSTVIGGVAKLVAEWAIGEVISRVLQRAAGDFAQDILQEMATNSRIPNAEGVELGHIVGLGALAYFSSAGMSRGLPTLSRGQHRAFAAMIDEQEGIQKEMDIAALSPFDVSSKYTFLGSILHNTRLAMVTNGTYNTSGLSRIISTISSLPKLALMPSAGAQQVDRNTKCIDPALFDQDTGATNPDDEPCINAAGTPEVGLTQYQMNMSINRPIEIAAENNWADEDQELDPEAGFHELMATSEVDDNGEVFEQEDGYFKAGTPLHDYFSTCTSPETGQYITNAAGCMTKDANNGDFSGAANAANQNGGNCSAESNPDTDYCIDPNGGDGDGIDVPTTEELAAIPLIGIDHQLKQSLDDNDNEEREGAVNAAGGNITEGSASGGPVSTEGWTWPLTSGVQTGPCYGRPVLGRLHAGMDMNSSTPNAPIYAMKDGIVRHAGPSAGGAGTYVQVETDDGIFYSLQHLSSANVSVGQRVTAGQQVGVGGKTGNVQASSPVHLHITTSPSSTLPSYDNLGVSFNPMDVLGGVPPPNGYRCN